MRWQSPPHAFWGLTDTCSATAPGRTVAPTSPFLLPCQQQAVHLSISLTLNSKPLIMAVMRYRLLSASTAVRQPWRTVRLLDRGWGRVTKEVLPARAQVLLPTECGRAYPSGSTEHIAAGGAAFSSSSRCCKLPGGVEALFIACSPSYVHGKTVRVQKLSRVSLVMMHASAIV